MPGLHSRIDDSPGRQFTPRMRFALFILMAGLIFSGCARTNSRNTDIASTPPVVTPSSSALGAVSSVNPTHRFVIVTFPPGSVPAPNQRLNVYRKGLKVGELRVTGPQIDGNTVADIIAGEAQLADDVRMD
jgi:hypothetical protein